MKPYLIHTVILLSFTTTGNSQSNYLDYPKSDSVYTRFFHAYSVDENSDKALLQFQKKPDGWHVVEFKNSYDSIVKDELFWSAKTEKFVAVNFEKRDDLSLADRDIAYYKHDYKNTFFSYFPYYNYIGFDRDVVKDYGDRKNLPDSILYAVGRSYSYIADNLLNNNSGLSDKKYRFKLGEGPDVLSPDQLATYCKYHDLAIKTFEELKKLNPNYETMVGNIGLKLADEYMVGYLDLMIYQNEKEADKELIQGSNATNGIYDYFMFSIAKNYLSSCDSNAILITYGDNDTYPLLYLQAKYKYRSDVLIVNNELIGLSRYINRMTRPFIGARPLPLTMSPEQYTDGVRDYLLYYQGNDSYFNQSEPSDLKKVMDFMLSNNESNKIALEDGSFINYLPVHNLFFPVNRDNVRKSKMQLNVGDPEKIESDTIAWRMNNSYLLKSNLILLNTLLANNWKRPICFTQGEEDQYLGLDKFFKLQGLVYELTPIYNSESNSTQNPMICTNEMYDLVMHTYLWGGISSIKQMGEQNIAMASNLRTNVTRLAIKLLDENKKDSALKVLNLCRDSIPENKCPYDAYSVFIIESYYRAGAIETANSISKKLFESSEMKMKSFPKNINSKREDDKYSAAYSNYYENAMILNRLLSFSQTYNQANLKNDFLKRITALHNNGYLDDASFNELPK